MGLFRPVELVVFIDDFIDRVDFDRSFCGIRMLLGPIYFDSVEIVELLLITIGQVPVQTKILAA